MQILHQFLSILCFYVHFVNFSSKLITLFCLLLQIVFEVYCWQSKFVGTFDIVSINRGNGWSPSSNAFIAPVTGIYYFSFSFGVQPNQGGLWGYIQIGSTIVCSSAVLDTDLVGLDLSSRGCLLSVKSGDLIKAISHNSMSDSSYAETTFKGFLYSPLGDVSVAWSIHSSGNIHGSGFIAFEQVFINLGGAWSNTSHSVTIPATGTYYIEMVGQTNDGIIYMSLMLNGDTVLLTLAHLHRSHSVTRSRSVLANCDK